MDDNNVEALAPGSAASSSNQRKQPVIPGTEFPGWVVGLVLAALLLAVYYQVATFDFVNCDDPSHVYDNPRVTGGLTCENIKWALFTNYFDFWHPMTWWSHMLDCELFGLRAGWHHLVNLALHIANTLLVFGLLRRMTGAMWRSATVAALFALHPLRVESVAWITERKDLLAGFFFLLTLLAYVGYVQSKKSEAQSPKSEDAVQSPPNTLHAPLSTLHWYLLSLLFFACALMSKPAVVTTPFVLLLLDFWPLRRFQFLEINPDSKLGSRRLENQKSKIKNLLVEKLPFFALTVATCLITYIGVSQEHRTLSTTALPWSLRLSNAIVSYVRYLGKTFWPAHLAVQYSFPSHWGALYVAACLFVLAFISVVAFLRAFEPPTGPPQTSPGFAYGPSPYLLFGWLYFVGILVPMLDFVAISTSAMSDRFTYIPSIGLFVAGVWLVSDYTAGLKHGSKLLGIITLLLVISSGVLSWRQTRYWRNSIELWSHCLAVTGSSQMAEFGMAQAMRVAGRNDEAIEYYHRELKLYPLHFDSNLNLGALLARSGQMREATNFLMAALQLQPTNALVHRNLGLALVELGDIPGAVEHCAEALRVDPKDFAAYVGLGRAYSAQEKAEEAMRCFSQAAALEPNSADAFFYLGLEQLKRGNYQDAASSLDQAARLSPDRPDIRTALAKAAKGRAD
jgi:Flp pilus assembly protein TadD